MNFSLKVDRIALDLEPDLNWAKILDPDPNSMYLDPQHWTKVPVMVSAPVSSVTVNADLPIGSVVYGARYQIYSDNSFPKIVPPPSLQPALITFPTTVRSYLM